MINIEDIDVYFDGAELDDISKFANDDLIKGFTTNPTLMRQAGINDYVIFAKEAANISGNKPISFEVFSDDFENMKKEAEIISSLSENIFVKIPITNTKGNFSGPLIKELSDNGIKLNITAIFTEDQCIELKKYINQDVLNIISLFCGRIADTGRNPEIICKKAKTIFTSPKSKILWASTRELYNLSQAINTNCDIITIPANIIKKFDNINKDLKLFSRETVSMFYNDAKEAGYKIL